MFIEIKGEKIVECGVQKTRITGIKALGYYELPTEYVDKDRLLPRCWVTSDTFVMRGEGAPGNVVVGTIYSPAEVEAAVAFAHKCGDRLREINARLREENKDWKGEVHYII